ncbi:MAG: hypothetical protein UY44_C0009G0019 [Candidatus Kaiserbacteria bacterium GW2011_GWA2_49_19]|uniref:Uncharacterized protein n=1 Tax=Candidatus Kaiserbacteria bacterium GW2011_GWA2_49_19 TaxID=1618669 RepID=A0A0G1VPX5_9BACT|nr:MAG: hypothetical protein UY44_C0009G0019 [Candidatus Kaiserbacteria bacterium GW2011_GWA2_49_19]
MRRFRHFFGLKTAALFIALAGLSFIQIAPVTAAGRCFCYGAGNEKSGCGPQTEATCKKDDDSVRGYKFEACLIQTDNAACEKEFADWKARQDSAAAAKGVASQSKFIPDCALAEKLDLKGPCGDVSVFVVLLLNASNYLFTIIGAIALAVFVYGGFMLIISQGNEEKITKGMDAIKASVIGLAIAFGGYFIIKFLGDSIGLKETFRL